jgi:GntR family transcriptional regulator / MocR family aminotransferase
LEAEKMKKTVYQKIYNDLITKITIGTLKTNDIMPSTRELAKSYKCHRFTVMKTYQDLAAEGWLNASERFRYKVSDKIPITGSSSLVKKTSFDISKITKPHPNYDFQRPKYKLEFWGGQPDLRLFPKDEFRRVLSAGLKRMKPEQLNYGSVTGLEPCIKEVSDYLRQSRNLNNKEYIVTNGSQEALFILFQTFLNAGDCIAIEKKGYPPAWRLFESLGAKLIPIEVDSEGLNTDDLQEKIKKYKIKMVYTTPLHQYPTTVTLSPRRRQSLIRICEKYHIPILEDDYDHEFHYTGLPPAPISTETDLGLYICSFSKVLFPGARLGVIGCDTKILKSISYQKYLVSRQTDCISQIGLSSWIKDGGFEKHLRRMRRIYESRYYFMLNKLEELKARANISWQNPNGGMSIWVNTNKDSQKLALLTKKQGVIFQYESSMDYTSDIGTHLRIGFALADEKEINSGLDVLKSII